MIIKCNFNAFLVFGGCIVSMLNASKPQNHQDSTEDRKGAQCSSIIVSSSDLVCQVEYFNESVHGTEDELKQETGMLTNPTKIINSAAKRIRCGKVSMTAFKRSKKNREQCMWTNCESSDKLQEKSGQSGRIVYIKKDIPTTAKITLIQMPVNVTPGMAITVRGAHNTAYSDSVLTYTTKPYSPTNLLAWVHMYISWKTRRLGFTHGTPFSTKTNKGDFPISDPSNFSLRLELTPSSAKVYADTVLVLTEVYIPTVKEINLRNFGKVYFMMIQKTDKE